MNKDRLLQIIKEEIQKHDKELNKKLNLYIAKLSKLRDEKSQKYLTEDQESEEALMSEISMIDKVIEDLNSIIYEE